MVMHGHPPVLYHDVIHGCMEYNPRADIKEIIIDVEEFIGEMNIDKVRMMLVELDFYIQDYERSAAVAFLSGNCTHNKHLALTALNGMYDDDIKRIMALTKERIVAEIEKRK